MKNNFRLFAVICVLVISLLITTNAFAQTPEPNSGTVYQGDKLVMADTFRLESDDVLQGNLVVIGGTVTIAENAQVNGDVVLVGGTLTNAGIINGNMVIIGGAATLEDTAVLKGDVVSSGGTLKQSPLAKVTGNITEQSPSEWNFGKTSPWKSPFQSNNNYLAKFLTICLESLGLAVLAVIVGLFLPDQTKRVSNTIVKEPLVTAGVGLVTIFCAPIAMILISLTIILIPVTFLAVIVFALALLYGWIAVGNVLGVRVSDMFHSEWATPFSSGIGTLLICLVIGSLSLIPIVGWLFSFMISLILIVIGLGAVVSSRFGSSKYANKVAQAVLQTPPMPVPPSAPVSPVASVPPSEPEPAQKSIAKK
jgi:hypothetical protein